MARRMANNVARRGWQRRNIVARDSPPARGLSVCKRQAEVNGIAYCGRK